MSAIGPVCAYATDTYGPDTFGARNETARVGEDADRMRCSPEGIRTLATALRGRRPRPLDDGARTAVHTRTTVPNFTRSSSTATLAGSAALGYQDSNLD